jgi:hypothetical protein
MAVSISRMILLHGVSEISLVLVWLFDAVTVENNLYSLTFNQSVMFYIYLI